MKYYQLNLHYKQGDDFYCIMREQVMHQLGLSSETQDKLGQSIEEALPHDAVFAKVDAAEAFRLFANHFEACRDVCKRLASVAKEHAVTIDTADTHWIQLCLEPEIGSALVKDGILYEEPDEDEDAVGDEDEEDDDDLSDEVDEDDDKDDDLMV